MEPRPWLEDGATELEKDLLRAGRADGPRKGADLRILAAIQGLPPPMVKPLTFARWMKLGLVAAVAGGAALVSQQLLRPHAAAPSAMVAEPTPAPAEAGAPRTAVVARDAAGGDETVGQARPAPLPAERPQAIAAPRTRATPPRPSHGPLERAAERPERYPTSPRQDTPPAEPEDLPRGDSLADETQALDRARVAVEAHQPAEALRVLDEYRRWFPEGRLRPESMILRLSALVQAGRRSAADSLANRLLSDETYRPYVPRIQSLLRELKR